MTQEIYTEEFVLEELRLLLKELREHPEYIYLGELFEHKDYTRQRFGEWKHKFPDNEEIQENSVTIKEILETRAVKGGLMNDLNASMTIFHLKNNYKWVDKSEIDNTNKTTLEFKNVEDMSMKELLERQKTILD